MEPPELQELPIGDDGAEFPADAPPPSGFLWLLYLYFRPRTFFRHFVMDPSPALTALCAWTYGMSAVINELGLDTFDGSSAAPTKSLISLWIFVSVGGVIAGLTYFYVGGWWYRVRLRWSGAKTPSRHVAQRVYLFAAQIVALPTVIWSASATSRYASGGPAPGRDAAVWYGLLLVFYCWSAWSSYVGVRTAFDVRRARALLWFFILPSLLYGPILGLMALEARARPELDRPAVHDSERMTFSYPGNWQIDARDAGYDPNRSLHVRGFPDVTVRIVLHRCDQPLEAELARRVDWYRDEYQHVRATGSFDTWGRFSGRGRMLEGQAYGAPYSMRVFVARVAKDWLLEVGEVHYPDLELEVAEALELIRSTFHLKE